MIREHWLFVLLFVAAAALQIPKLRRLKEFILLAQDYNPVHFGRLYNESDMPERDDQEVGENGKFLGLSSLFFSLPILLSRFGVPLEWPIGAQVLLGPSLLMTSVYVLTLTVVPVKGAALIAALLACYREYVVFCVNTAYRHLFFNRFYYFNDHLLAPTGFSLACLVTGRLELAALLAGLVMLHNPTFGLNLGGLLLFHLCLFSGRPPAGMALPGLILVASMALTYVMVRRAAPIKNPCPEPARILAIRSYPEIAPHVVSPGLYFLAVACLLAMLGYAWTFETWLRPMAFGVANPGAASVLAAVGSFMILQGLIVYWLAYVRAPLLMPMLAPGKLLMICALFFLPYAGYAAYEVFRSMPLALILPLLAYDVGLRVKGGLMGRHWAWIGIVCVMLLHLLLGLFVGPALFGPYSDLGAYILAAILLTDFVQGSQWLFRSPESRLDMASAFLDIQEKIDATIEKDAVFLPYTLPGTRRNVFGILYGFAFRTYSRRGCFVFWSNCRNAYFDSMRRHQLEQLCYAGMGIDFWGEFERGSERELARSKLAYFTGLTGTFPRLEFLGSSPLWNLRLSLVEKIKRKALSSSLPEFMRYGRRLGATHLLLIMDPAPGAERASEIEVEVNKAGKTVSYPILASNACFAVVKIV